MCGKSNWVIFPAIILAIFVSMTITLLVLGIVFQKEYSSEKRNIIAGSCKINSCDNAPDYGYVQYSVNFAGGSEAFSNTIYVHGSCSYGVNTTLNCFANIKNHAISFVYPTIDNNATAMWIVFVMMAIATLIIITIMIMACIKYCNNETTTAKAKEADMPPAYTDI